MPHKPPVPFPTPGRKIPGFQPDTHNDVCEGCNGSIPILEGLHQRSLDHICERYVRKVVLLHEAINLSRCDGSVLSRLIIARSTCSPSFLPSPKELGQLAD